MQLGELEVALEIAKASEGTEAKWKQLGELAMSSGRLDVRSPDDLFNFLLLSCSDNHCLLPSSESMLQMIVACNDCGILSSKS